MFKKLLNNRIFQAVVAILIAIRLYDFLKPKKIDTSGADFVVYGTDWCGYTTKQRKHLDSKYGQGSHVYVNCEEHPEKCKGMKGFPVTEKKDGSVIVGFNSQL
jgi:hypothetical protein